MTDPVRIGNIFTRVNGCNLDHELGEGYGLLQKFAQLKASEAVSGTAWRQCEDNETGKGSNLKITVDENGYCAARCTSDCRFMRKR